MSIYTLILAILTALLPQHPVYTPIEACEDTTSGPCVMWDQDAWEYFPEATAPTWYPLAECPAPGPRCLLVGLDTGNQGTPFHLATH